MIKKNIVVIGYGFVGKAMAACFPDQNVFVVDPNPCVHELNPKTNVTFYESVDDIYGCGKMDAIFICVPTPMGDNGAMDSRILNHVLEDIWDYFTCYHHPLIPIVLKSTVIPTAFQDIRRKFLELSAHLVYNPEFLTERNAFDDMINADLLVLGAKNKSLCDQIEDLYRQYSICNVKEVHKLTLEEASFVKYGINSYLASKLIWFMEYSRLLDGFGSVRPGAVIRAMTSDKSHATWESRCLSCRNDRTMVNPLRIRWFAS